MTGAAVRFYIVYELSTEARQRGIADLTRWMENGQIKHAVAATLPLEKTAEAHELVEQGKTVGNVVVQP